MQSESAQFLKQLQPCFQGRGRVGICQKLFNGLLMSKQLIFALDSLRVKTDGFTA